MLDEALGVLDEAPGVILLRLGTGGPSTGLEVTLGTGGPKTTGVEVTLGTGGPNTGLEVTLGTGGPNTGLELEFGSVGTDDTDPLASTFSLNPGIFICKHCPPNGLSAPQSFFSHEGLN